MTGYILAPNKFVTVYGDIKLNYREVGVDSGIPLLLLNHLSGTLDNWDPLLIDLLSQTQRVIVFDNEGVGLSNGQVPEDIESMADTTAAFIQALKIEKVNLLGLSMGGFVAQAFIVKYPQFVQNLILVGTGPKGDKKISRVGNVVIYDFLRALMTGHDVKAYLFFTRSDQGKSKAREFLQRLKQRTVIQDKPISLKAYRNQLRAIKKYATGTPHDLKSIQKPTLIVNGDSDRMVPTQGSYVLKNTLPNAQLVIYRDAGHMSLFQEPVKFVEQLNAFNKRLN
ncbi:alpha/beta fold hydrolase [Leuconostoc lactis]|uniref:alpha/beta fold hydrolase n=1 Tax=Leuconostoc lactis TaxID=1246 RepID=UPI000815135D|nr:alpha/beta hydrolase [Leuconostoc lactis]ANY12395.1 alpha/beta hydrolase [Leuconostoc lactis]